MTKRGRRLSHDDFRHGCACSLEGYDAALELAKPLLEQLDVVHGVAEGVFLEGSTHLFLQPVDALLTRLADIADLDAGNVVDKTLDGVETGKPLPKSRPRQIPVLEPGDVPVGLIALVGLSAVSSIEEKALDAAAARFEARGARSPRTSLGLALGAIAAGTQLAPPSKKSTTA